MGTSAARRAPTGRWWRLAKGAATRYLSPEKEGGVEVREVAARYLAALEGSAGEAGQGVLAAFSLTRKVAQDLGAFWTQAVSQGWEAALDAWGVPQLKGQPPEIAALGLSAALAGPGSGLEEAVARTALAKALLRHLPFQDYLKLGSGPSSVPEPHLVVQHFLGTALSRRLVLDLGESLEAAGRDFRRLQAGLAGLTEYITKAALDSPITSPTQAEQWRGLTGWLRVTQIIETLHKILVGG
jgi:hypothetical protein